MLMLTPQVRVNITLMHICDDDRGTTAVKPADPSALSIPPSTHLSIHPSIYPSIICTHTINKECKKYLFLLSIWWHQHWRSSGSHTHTHTHTAAAGDHADAVFVPSLVFTTGPTTRDVFSYESSYPQAFTALSCSSSFCSVTVIRVSFCIITRDITPPHPAILGRPERHYPRTHTRQTEPTLPPITTTHTHKRKLR